MVNAIQYDVTTGETTEVQIDIDLPGVEYFQGRKITELDAACTQDILSGFACVVKGEARNFGFDMNDQMNLTGKLTMLNANPEITAVFWKCKGLEGILDSYTREEFNLICKAADDTKTAKIAKFWQKKAAVLAATTIEEVNAVVW